MFPAIQAVDAPLKSVVATKSIRPPALNAPRPPPKASSAPAPRPSAPSRPEFSPPTPHASVSSADDLASALSHGTSNQAALVNAPDSASLADAVSHAPSRLTRPAGHDPFFFRKASIPILLTFAVVPFCGAVLLTTSGEDNALPDLFPPWAPLALLAISAVCLALAALNMLAMRNVK